MRAPGALLEGGAFNCNAVPWGSWRWTPERLVCLLVCVSLVLEAHGRRASAEDVRRVAWLLGAEGPASAWRLLEVCGVRGAAASRCCRAVLVAAGAVDLRRARLGLARSLASREGVAWAAWRSMRAAGASREVCAAELGGLVRIWAPREASAWLASSSSGWS